jgi:DNA-directed RNA polymerase specialized sigma24 family protein
MSSEGSITRWLGAVQTGDPAAVQQLWERFFPRLVGLARKKLEGAAKRAADEEDIALSAFDSFCRSAEHGRFPDLLDRESLWGLLVVITARKAAHLLRDERRQKRGGGMLSADPTPESPSDTRLDQILSREPSPEFAAQAAEECQRLLRSLGAADLEALALLKMEGYTIEEISGKLGFAPRSIRRKLQMIRTIWEKEVTA